MRGAWVTSLATSAFAAGSAGGVMVSVLGLEEIALPAPLAPLDLVWYRVGDDELHLVRDERGATHTAQHFCVQVDDVAALRRRLRQR